MAMLSFSYDAASDIATIEGVKFSGDLLRTLAGVGLPENCWFRVARQDEVVKIRESFVDPREAQS